MPYDEQKLTDVFRTIFNLPDLVLRDELTARDVPGWDSFNHVNLVIAIEMEFGVTFTTDEIAALENVGQLKQLLKSKF
jgi:acyl carrier protein